MSTDPKKARILVVEDDRCIALLYRHLLGQRFDLEFVDNVESALLMAQGEHFDLFLLDINLGEVRDGVDLLGLLRQMPAYDGTPAISCTAT